MKQHVIKLLVMSTVALYGMQAGEQGKTPESLGAHWARVPDAGQIGFVVDKLTEATRCGIDQRITRRLLAPQTEAPSFVRTSSARVDVIIGDATTAQARTTEGTVRLMKANGTWVITGGVLPIPATSIGMPAPFKSIGSAGETFIATPVSREQNIDRLSRSVTREKLDRSLFREPDKTASYYYAHYMESAPFISAMYIQFVTDPSWNRVVYGNLNRWIKSYDNLNGPSTIATDPDGRVFIGETGNERITVLRIVGEGAEASLQPQFVINGIHNPTDIAHSDNGTPLNTSDDFLYVADASQNKVFKYALSTNGASLVATFEGFDSPNTIAVGKWNGASNNLIYVIDQLAKRIRVFDDQGSQLSLIKEVRGTYVQYFKSLKVDHHGNVYTVDNVNSQVFKYSSSLELLDTQGGDDTFAAIGNVEIPFGKIVVDGQGTYWAGFDQLFALERWSDNSGVQRRMLGLKMKDIAFAADDDASVVQNTFILTDFGQMKVRVYNNAGQIIRTLRDGWMVSGSKEIVWDRRMDNGTQVPPGSYRYEVVGTQSYRDEPVISQTQLSLPLYYHEDCGSVNPTDDVHLVRGSSVRWGSSPSQTAEEDPSSVMYRFTNLDPSSEYEVAAEYVAPDNTTRLQEMRVNGTRLHDPVAVSTAPYRTGYMKLSKNVFAGGEVTISINALEQGSAIVSQLWIKETGKGFSAQQIDNLIPSAYALEQNYPNPFNPSTTIRYALPNDANVTLKVYDITGREVATLVSEQKKAGTYEIRFDARNGSGRILSSGVYFYQIRAGEYVQTRKFVLLK